MTTTNEPVYAINGKKIAFPAATKFDELFSSATPKTGGIGDQSPTLYTGRAWDGRRFYLTGYCFRSAPFAAWNVTAAAPVLEYVKDNVLHCGNDRMYFELVQWDDGKTLVVAQHNVICGNHYLAVIDTASVPAYERG
jgi:hypothetical protein